MYTMRKDDCPAFRLTAGSRPYRSMLGWERSGLGGFARSVSASHLQYPVAVRADCTRCQRCFPEREPVIMGKSFANSRSHASGGLAGDHNSQGMLADVPLAQTDRRTSRCDDLGRECFGSDTL